jgi:hypothetical protein
MCQIDWFYFKRRAEAKKAKTTTTRSNFLPGENKNIALITVPPGTYNGGIQRG